MTKKKDSNSFPDDLEIRAKDAKTVRKIVGIILIAFSLIFVIGILSGYFYIKSALEPVDPDSNEQVEIDIPIGSSTVEIATLLEDFGLIKNSKIFRFYLKFKNYSDFQAGEYTLSPSLTLDEIVEELQSGKVIEEPLYRLTIPEGKAIDQIATIVEKKLDIPADDFKETTKDKAVIEDLMDEYPNLVTDKILDDDVIDPLEGYLYAGTFEIYEEAPTAESIIKLMVDQTNTVMKEHKKEIGATNMSIHELLTLASMVERESKFSEDRPKVAQVFLNRLHEDMNLQSDITAAYANGEHKIVMTYEDVEINSPYNTYVQNGLPPGPIASPSKEAIMAVLEPEGEDFTELYFYARPNGETYYAQTLKEHNQYVEQYRQEWYDLEEESKNKSGD